MEKLDTKKILVFKDNFLVSEWENNCQEKWKLDQLKQIIITDDFKRLRDTTASNATKGAVVGGVVDSMMGDGDSIIDGVIVGAVVGGLFSDDQKIVDSDGTVVLVFKDGLSIPVRLNNEEYTRLVSIAINNKNRDIEIEDSFLVYMRTKEEIKQIGKRNKFIEFFGFVMFVVAAYFFYKHVLLGAF